MRKQRVRLIFRSVTEIADSNEIGLLLLTDAAELRQVALPCTKFITGEFCKRINNRPLTMNSLPEALWNTIQWQTDLRLEVHIDKIKEGRYMATLTNADTFDEVPIDAAEGVLLSLVSRGDIPVMMDERLFLRQSTTFDPHSPGVSLPVNTITDDMLQTALDRAIAAENYEMAKQLHQEQERRKQWKKDGESKENCQDN